MATSTLRPNSTVSNTGTIFPSGTADSVLADDDDSNVVGLEQGEAFEIGFDDLSLPAGAVVARVVARLRAKRGSSPFPTGTPVVSATLAIGDDELPGNAVISWTAPATMVVLSESSSYADADVDAATLSVTNTAADSALIVAEAYLDVIYVAEPVVTITSPSGTVTDDDTPTVEWEDSVDSDGGAQTIYRVVYMTNGDDPETDTPVADSGELTGADTSWTPEDSLPNATYDIYVKVAQTVNGVQHWSEWDEQADVVLDVDQPADPDLLLTTEGAGARIRLDLSDPGGGAVTTDHFQIQRSDDDGETWANIRTVDGGGLIDPTAGEATAWDRELANGGDSLYRVRAVHDFAAGTSSSAWVEAGPTSWTSTDTWIKSASDPSLDLVTEIYSQPGRVRAARQGKLTPLDSPYPVVISGTRGSREGQITFMVEEDDVEAFEALLDTEGPFLIQAPADHRWDDKWVTLGDEDATRYVDKIKVDEGLRAFTWTEVAAPTDNLIAWPDPAVLPAPDGDDLILI